MNRRSILKTMGAASALGGLANTAKAQQTHEICINAPSDRSSGYPYQFAVSGRIEKIDHADHAPWDDHVVTADAEDDLPSGGCRVHGYVAGGVDCYRFTGDIVAFSVPNQWEAKYTIHTNGHERTPADLTTQQDPSDVDCTNDDSDDQDASAPDPDAETHDSQGFCELTNTLRVTPHKTKSDPFVVEVEVSDQLELENGQRVSAARFTVEGRGTAGAMQLSYSGVITALDTQGPGYVTITQDDVCE